MELNALLDKIQSKLVINDEMLENIDSKRAELRRICKEEEIKISIVCDQVKERVMFAGEALKNKINTVCNDLDQVLVDRREVVRTGSLVLCPEIEKITDVIQNGKEAAFDVDNCWENVKEVIDHKQPDNVLMIPLFYPSSTLSKVKACDIGYLCMAEFLPSQFELLLTSIIQLTSNSHSIKVACTIKTDQMFTDNIQSYIKFSIKNTDCNDSVTYCKEDCKLSEDKKCFQISFLAHQSGLHLVTVLLYGQHISNSPLTIPVTKQQLPVPADRGVTQVASDIIKQETVECPPSSSDPNHNSCPVEARPTQSLTTPSVSEAFIPLHIAATPSSNSSSSPSISPYKPGLSGSLDLQLHFSKGKLSCLKVLSLEAGTKPGSVSKPIGMCLLQNKNIVVSSTFDDKVRMFSPSGQFLSLVTVPKSPFTRPTDMVTLHYGQFVVRDDNKVIIFTSEGKYLRTLWQDKGQVKCFGLAQDKKDRLVTIMETRNPKRTDLLFFDINSGELVRKIEMVDIISDKARSKCRFLTYQLDKLYITDLGLDCVYILDPATISVKVFGCSGSGDGQFSDPAGLVVDSVGNMVVADSRNHRLCLYTQDGKFVCKISLSPETRRPSGVVLDTDKRELYVLNLQGREAMTKYKIR